MKCRESPALQIMSILAQKILVNSYAKKKDYEKVLHLLFHSIFSALLNLPYPLNNKELKIAVDV